MRLTGARLLWKMTKLKFSLLDVKLASRKQKRNEKRTRGEWRLLNSPTSSSSSSSNTPNLAITLGVWTMTLRRMTLEYYNDDRRCKELLEIGWKTEYGTLQKIEFLERNDGMGDVRKKFRFICYINFRFSFGSSENKISFDNLIKLLENKRLEAVPRSNLKNDNSEFAYLQNTPKFFSYRRLSTIRFTLFVWCYDILMQLIKITEKIRITQ